MKTILSKTTIWWAFGLTCGNTAFPKMCDAMDKNQLWQSLGYMLLVLGFAIVANIACDLIHGFEDKPDNIPNSKEP